MIPTRIARQLTPMLFSGSNKAERRFWEFFTANIRNPNTRLAYLTAAYRFADWCEVKGLALRAGRADDGCRIHRAVDNGLRAGDRQAIPGGHPDAVRLARDRPGCALQSGQLGTGSPKYVVKTGKTPVLTAGETRGLLDSDRYTGTLVGPTRSRRDRPHGVQLRTGERGGGDAGGRLLHARQALVLPAT